MAQENVFISQTSFKTPVSEDYLVMSRTAGPDLHQKELIRNVKAGGSLGCRTMK